MAKERCSRFAYWYEYQGKKCPLGTYSNRTARGMKPEDAIKPIKYVNGQSLRKFYEEYEGKKVTKHVYYRAIQIGYSKEEAISNQLSIAELYPKEYEFREKYDGEKLSFTAFLHRLHVISNKEQAIKPKKQHISGPTHKQAKRVIPGSYYGIDITYSTEEAKVFHSIYCGIIDKLEQQILEEENYPTLRELEEKLEFIQQEYQSFLTFNPL